MIALTVDVDGEMIYARLRKFFFILTLTPLIVSQRITLRGICSLEILWVEVDKLVNEIGRLALSATHLVGVVGVNGRVNSLIALAKIPIDGGWVKLIDYLYATLL